MSPRDARDHKPRHYDGPVDWVERAKAVADAWTDAELAAVLETWPYHHTTGARHRAEDWALLVAHVSSTRQEDVVGCAERLALYVSVYAEAHQTELSPEAVRASQTHSPEQEVAR